MFGYKVKKAIEAIAIGMVIGILITMVVYGFKTGKLNFKVDVDEMFDTVSETEWDCINSHEEGCDCLD